MTNAPSLLERMRKACRGVWPSITLKVMLSAAIMMVVSWFVVIALVFYNASSPSLGVDGGDARHTVLRYAEVLHDRPVELLAVVQGFDRYLRNFGTNVNMDRDDPGERTSIQLFDGHQLVFATPRLPQDIHVPTKDWGRPELREGHDSKWWQVCDQSSDRRFTACVLTRHRGAWDVVSYFLGSDFILWPAALTLPVLFFPILLALLWGLRPLKHLQAFIHEHGGDAEAAIPMSKVPVELRPLASTITRWSEQHARSTAREHSFVANAAHELRTPLAAIRVNAEGLQQLHLPERATVQLQGLMSGVRRMSRVVDQLMTTLRNDRHVGKEVGQGAHRLDVMLQMRLAELSALADRKQVTLSLCCSEPCTVTGVREVMESVIDNIVSNAIKYSDLEQEVRIELRRHRGQAHLKVEDRGPGIPDHLKEAVFERFRRGADHGQSGVGLGLAIVQEGVASMGGNVCLMNREQGPGLVVLVTLPLTVRSGDNG